MSAKMVIGGAFDYDRAFAESQAAIGREAPSALVFRDTRGRPVTMDTLRGKPLLVSFIYTSCYKICPMTTQYLSQVVEKALEALGQDSFNVITVGFDTHFDSPEQMRVFARKQRVDLPNWQFLSGNAENVNALVEALGFLYFRSPKGYDHLIQTTIIDADGKVYRQVYGEVFDTPLLIEPLKELVLGRPQPNETVLDETVRRVRLFCTVYDPNSDTYRFDISLFIGMGIGILIIGGGFRFWYVERKRAKALEKAAEK